LRHQFPGHTNLLKINMVEVLAQTLQHQTRPKIDAGVPFAYGEYKLD
jgi:hypothetical protein